MPRRGHCRAGSRGLRLVSVRSRCCSAPSCNRRSPPGEGRSSGRSVVALTLPQGSEVSVETLAAAGDSSAIEPLVELIKAERKMLSLK